MPEMPEVETLVRKLRRRLVGKRIARVNLSGFSLRKPIAGGFSTKLCGRKIQGITRRGKYLIAELEPKCYWLIHLGMSGRILIHSKPDTCAKHTHVRVRFSDSSELEYRDPRRFGLMAVYEVSDLNQIPEIRLLGLDPLSAEFNGEWLGMQLRGSRREVKSFLLDQRRVSGLGNIYVCESLFRARIHPQRRCFTVTRREAVRLADAIRDVLAESIQRRGTSFSDFVDVDGKPGENQKHLMVFQREGELCRVCGIPIRRMVQGNRSSFYCPNCQD